MPVIQSGSSATPHEQSVQDALELFCGSHEQTYEEFLASFTHLSSGDVEVADGSRPAMGSAPRPPSESAGGRMGGRRGGVEEKDPAPGGMRSPMDQDEVHADVVLDAGVAVGRGGDGERRPPGRVKVDNYLDLADFSEEEEDVESVAGALPGEVREDPPAYPPSFCRHTQLELRTCPRPGVQREHLGTQTETEEVLPFSMDEDFDYDHVVLSRKHPVP